MHARAVDREEFRALLERMAEGWNGGDAEAVSACFAEELSYVDPTRYAFTRVEDLRPFFEPPEGGRHSVVWHTILFDEQAQSGAAEYTYTGHRRYHGAVLVRVAKGVAVVWREWQHESDREWHDFISGGP